MITQSRRNFRADNRHDIGRGRTETVRNQHLPTGIARDAGLRDRIVSRFPTGERDEATLQRHVLTIDSRSRDNFASTTASDYTIKFPAISQVKKMRLISTEIPNTQYVFNSVTSHIDLIDVGGGGGAHVVTITPGSYSATELANEINLKLNAAVGVGFGIEFVVTYITFTKKFRIDRLVGGNFSLLFATGPSVETSAGHNLGFTTDVVNVASATSDQIVDLAGDNYVYLQIRGFPTITNTENIEDVFAKIIWNVPPAFVTYDSFAANDIIFRNPIQLLSEFKVKFVRQDGRLYEFNNVEHSFSIEIFSTVQT